MFRWRDAVALIFALILSQQAWNRQESLSATVHLAFYAARTTEYRLPSLRPVPLDVNGDGIPESLVDYSRQSGAWKLQVLDIIKKRRHGSNLAGAPYEPPVVLESDPISYAHVQGRQQTTKDTHVQPLTLTVGHVRLRPDAKSSSSSSSKKKKPQSSSSKVEITDRNRRFFCGTSWHDAAEKCSVPCPSGMASDCPDGETCYADTPCNYEDATAEKDQTDETSTSTTTSIFTDVQNITHHFHLTPDGGLPCVVTLWSSGVVTLHSIAASYDRNQKSSSSRNKHRDNKDHQHPQFEIQLMWHTQILPAKKQALEWLEQTVHFVDAVDADNGSGLILISGNAELTEEDDDDDDAWSADVVAALHARTGQIIWSSAPQEDDSEHEDAHRPTMQRGTTSMARRRSRIPNIVHGSASSSVRSMSPEHCLRSFYRRPLLMSTTTSSSVPQGALPFSYWTEADASIRTLHFDLEQPESHQQHQQQPRGAQQKRKKKKQRLHYGKPNVVVTHDLSGLQVRSLRNGRSLCHLGLSEETIYADLNHDGTLDGVEIAMGTHAVPDVQREQEAGDDADDDYRFIAALASRMADREQKKSSSKKKKKEAGANIGRRPSESSLCHLVALSGFPSKEELFSANLCGKRYDARRRNDMIEGAPPILVEPMYGKGLDVIAAVNTGLVHRIRGSNGWRQWKTEGQRHDGFPHWNNREIAQLSRVESHNVVPETRPVLLVGEDALAILSVKTGTVLASAKFPQPSITRPILVDFDGDGTTDVMIQSKEALWAFKIVVRTGSSVLLRILVGLLLMGLLLAMLRNRYGPHPGKRSTDI